MRTGRKTKGGRQLVWSEQGQVGCTLPGHAPYRGSDTYYFERWRVMKPAEIAAWTRDVGRPPACETCAADEREARAKSNGHR
jgi:hypothetical protein